MPPPTPVPTADDPWSPLQQGCAAALTLSRDIRARLEHGAAAADLVPLLEREREAVAGVLDGIAAFSGRVPAGVTDRRGDIARQLTELIDLDGRNREFLARRGVRLTRRGPA